MKKTFALIFTGVLLGSTVAFAAVKLFSDVPSNTWYSEAVASLADKGIIAGYPDGTFGPTKNVNRAELAVMLDRLIEYIETGGVATSTSEIAFDSCGTLSEYSNKSWYSSFQTKYKTVENITYTIGEPTEFQYSITPSGGDGCLSLDESTFIFIPPVEPDVCRHIYKYNIANSALTVATGPYYCAVEFGSRVGDYIQFSGQQTGESCLKYSGKYYFKEDTVKGVSESSC